jgi:hypothetical protein
MTRRTNLWTYFYNQYGDLSQPENFERCLGMMMRYKRLVVLEPDPDRLHEEFWQGEPTYGRLFALLEEQVAQRKGKPRWGDKSLNTERYAEPIFAAYPGARILHMIRDPRDRYASVLARWKSRRGGVGAGTAMWLSSVSLAEENRRRFPNQYKIVRYETLATKPEETLREICAFIDEAYAPEMLTMRGAKTFREQGSNSSYGQRKPGVISTNSIGRFRQVLSPVTFSWSVAPGATALAIDQGVGDVLPLTSLLRRRAAQIRRARPRARSRPPTRRSCRSSPPAPARRIRGPRGKTRSARTRRWETSRTPARANFRAEQRR